jgi:hypothetical protein
MAMRLPSETTPEVDSRPLGFLWDLGKRNAPHCGVELVQYVAVFRGRRPRPFVPAKALDDFADLRQAVTSEPDSILPDAVFKAFQRHSLAMRILASDKTRESSHKNS